MWKAGEPGQVPSHPRRAGTATPPPHPSLLQNSCSEMRWMSISMHWDPSLYVFALTTLVKKKKWLFCWYSLSSGNLNLHINSTPMILCPWFGSNLWRVNIEYQGSPKGPQTIVCLFVCVHLCGMHRFSSSEMLHTPHKECVPYEVCGVALMRWLPWILCECVNVWIIHVSMSFLLCFKFFSIEICIVSILTHYKHIFAEPIPASKDTFIIALWVKQCNYKK